MRRDSSDCGCTPCCKRVSLFQVVTPETLVTEPFEYWIERHHEITVSISCSARPAGDTSSSPYWFEPVTVDTLLWCDENGQNEAGRLRVRVEHGQVRNLENGSADVSPLATHTVACRSDANLIFRSPPSIKDVVELLIYLEFVKADGTVSQSVQVNRVYSSEAYTFPTLVVVWDVWLRNDTIYASANVSGVIGNAQFPNPANSLAFPYHVFSPETVTNGILYNRHGCYTQPNPRISVDTFHYAKRRVSIKTPCIPADVSPYCEGGDYENKPAAWPWRNVGDCTAWKRSGRIVGLPCSSTKDTIRLVIPLADPVWGAGPSQMGMMIDGTYELTNNAPSGNKKLANSLFWFGDASPEKTQEVTDSAGTTTYTLKSLEISAVLSLNRIQASLKAPCSNNDWVADVFFVLSCVIEATRASSLTYQNGTTFNRYTSRFSFAGGLNFLNGSEVEFRPYGSSNTRSNALNTQSGHWPFVYFSIADASYISYGPHGSDGPPFTIKLM